MDPVVLRGGGGSAYPHPTWPDGGHIPLGAQDHDGPAQGYQDGGGVHPDTTMASGGGPCQGHMEILYTPSEACGCSHTPPYCCDGTVE